MMVAGLLAAILSAARAASSQAPTSPACCAFTYRFEVQPQEPVGIPPFPIAYGLSVVTLAPEDAQNANVRRVRATIGQDSDEIFYDAQGRESGFGSQNILRTSATLVNIGDRQLVLHVDTTEQPSGEISISGEVHPVDSPSERVEFVEEEKDGAVVQAAFHEFLAGAERMRLYLTLDGPPRAAHFAFPTLYFSCLATRENIFPTPPRTSCFP